MTGACSGGVGQRAVDLADRANVTGFLEVGLRMDLGAGPRGVVAHPTAVVTPYLVHERQDSRVPDL